MCSRWCVGVIVAAAGFLVLGGCGSGTPTFDPATAYSPASLASELAFRYKSLNPESRNVRKPQPARKADAAATKEAKAATKEAQATTLDDLIRDVATKAATIPGMNAAEAMSQVATAVDGDASLPDADRKTIVARLRGSGE